MSFCKFKKLVLIRKLCYAIPLFLIVYVILYVNLTTKSTKHNEKILAGNFAFQLNSSTHVYEIDSKPVIWFYWHDANDMPAFAKILIEAVKCVNQRFVIITVDKNAIGDYWPDYPKRAFSKLLPAHQADLFRVHVLQRFGGVYLDVDTFPVSSLTPFYEALNNHHLIGSNWRPMNTQLSVGHLGPVRANVMLFKIWAFWQDRIIDDKTPHLYMPNMAYPLTWSELLSDISTSVMNHTMQHNLIRYFQLDGLRTVGQLVTFNLADDVTQTLNATFYERLKLLKSTPLLYFHNSKQPKLKQMTEEELLNPPEETLFSYFAKCAMKKCDNKRSFETRYNTNFSLSLYPCIL